MKVRILLTLLFVAIGLLMIACPIYYGYNEPIQACITPEPIPTISETVSDLLVSIDMPEFIPETWDCDDIALHLKSEMTRLYGLNCVGYAEGDYVGFYHAWNIVLTSEGVFTWEGELQQWNNESWYDASLIWF